MSTLLVVLPGFLLYSHIAYADDQADLMVSYKAAEDKLRAGDGSAEVWIEVLEALYRLDQPLKALGAARVAAIDHAEHPALSGYIARAYFRGGFADEAAKLLDRVALENVGAVTALTRSKLLHSEGQSGPALEVANRGLLRTPDDAELLYQAALLHGWRDNVAEALRMHEKALAHAADLKGYPKELIISRSSRRKLVYEAANSRSLNSVVKTGTSPFTLPGQFPLPTIAVQLNGHTAVNMLLDLGGSPAMSLDTAVAKEAGIELLGEVQTQDVTGESSNVKWALTDQVNVGQIELRSAVTQVYPFNENELPGIKGVIGSGLFAGKRLIIDFEQLSLSIGESGPPAPSAVSDLLRTPLSVRFLSGDQGLIRVQIKDRTINGIFDMGTPVSCLSTRLMTLLKEPSAIQDRQVGGHQAKISSQIPFRIGRRTFAQAQTLALPFIEKETSRTVGTQVDMLLGWDVLREMRRLTVDVPANQIIIDWKPAPKRAKPARNSK